MEEITISFSEELEEAQAELAGSFGDLVEIAKRESEEDDTVTERVEEVQSVIDRLNDKYEDEGKYVLVVQDNDGKISLINTTIGPSDGRREAVKILMEDRDLELLDVMSKDPQEDLEV